MYGSLFREWKVAATFVGGIAFLVAMVFSEGGGHEQLALQRKAAEPAVAVAPLPGPPLRSWPATVGGFTPDAELEAAFAAPTPAASADANEETIAALPAGANGAPPAAPTTELSPGPEQLR